jgi:hypothetical protein
VFLLLGQRLLPDHRAFRDAPLVRQPPSRVLVARPEDEQLHGALDLGDGLSAHATVVHGMLGDSQDDPQPDTTFLNFPQAARPLGVYPPGI